MRNAILISVHVDGKSNLHVMEMETSVGLYLIPQDQALVSLIFNTRPRYYITVYK